MSASNAVTPNDSALGALARGHLCRLAREPRPTSSASAAEARQYCAEALTSLGFRVRELPFEYSAAVGAYGTPVAGLIICLMIGGAALSTLGGNAAFAVGLLIAGGIAVALGGQWLARRGVLALPVMRRRGVNLEATRGDDDPALWLVAHLDSKSQPVPLLVRAAGVVILALAWIAASLLALRSIFGHTSPELWRSVIFAAVVGAAPVVASVVGARSPGAVDNASGVATVLAAAAALVPVSTVGVLITDAEELGLAGARAWCSETKRRPSPVLNCDGVDDAGQLTLMWTRPRATRLERALRDATKGEAPLRVIPLVPGVLVDGVAFSDAGRESVTLSRGSSATLRRIHTRRDSLEEMKGEGLTLAALLLARAARTITESH